MPDVAFTSEAVDALSAAASAFEAALLDEAVTEAVGGVVTRDDVQSALRRLLQDGTLLARLTPPLPCVH